MRKRQAMQEAHRQAAACLRQLTEADAGLADDEAESDEIAAALLVLAERHERASGDARPSV